MQITECKWKHSLLDNAPNYLIGCIIQKRYQYLGLIQHYFSLLLRKILVNIYVYEIIIIFTSLILWHNAGCMLHIWCCCRIFFSSMLLPSAFEFWRGTLFWYYVFTAKNVHYSTHLELSGWPSGQRRFNQKITLGKVIYLLGIHIEADRIIFS